jgi:hypothetical protein
MHVAWLGGVSHPCPKCVPCSRPCTSPSWQDHEVGLDGEWLSEQGDGATMLLSSGTRSGQYGQLAATSALDAQRHASGAALDCGGHKLSGGTICHPPAEIANYRRACNLKCKLGIDRRPRGSADGDVRPPEPQAGLLQKVGAQLSVCGQTTFSSTDLLPIAYLARECQCMACSACGQHMILERSSAGSTTCCWRGRWSIVRVRRLTWRQAPASCRPPPARGAP